MALFSQQLVTERSGGRGRTLAIVGLVLLLAAAIGLWRGRDAAPAAQTPDVVPVTSAVVGVADVPVRLSAKGTVSAVQSVEVRARINATIDKVQIREGQFVRRGEPLFSLDTRAETASLRQAEAQLAKSRADLANAESNLRRQRELLARNYISAAAFDVVRNQLASLQAQVEADRAAIEASRVGRGYGEIVAPIAGRTGAVAVYPGTLVQASGPVLVSISQLDPIHVAFTLPERELPALQKALAGGSLAVSAQLDDTGDERRAGELVFVDNNVDSASGTIRLKASFANADGRLWPGMFVPVSLAPRTLAGALVVPVQAVQTGPENQFVYVIGTDGEVAATPVRTRLIQDGQAVIDGVAAGARVVVDGAQNLRPGSRVRLADQPSAAPQGQP
jgi:RND family efflux transporter MFP subunit